MEIKKAKVKDPEHIYIVDKKRIPKDKTISVTSLVTKNFGETDKFFLEKVFEAGRAKHKRIEEKQNDFVENWLKKTNLTKAGYGEYRELSLCTKMKSGHWFCGTADLVVGDFKQMKLKIIDFKFSKKKYDQYLLEQLNLLTILVKKYFEDIYKYTFQIELVGVICDFKTEIPMENKHIEVLSEDERRSLFRTKLRERKER